MENWEARAFIHVHAGGRTLPLQASCVCLDDRTRQRQDFLIKSVGHPEVTMQTLFFEYLCLTLATYFGINTPRPALIYFSPTFVQSVGDSDVLSALPIVLQPGYGIGIEYLPGLTPLPREPLLGTPAELAQAAHIYAFDNLVQNPDRTSTQKTNCALQNNRLLAFDFELSFSFCQLILSVCEPWEVDAILAKQHLFYSVLRGKHTNLLIFLNQLKMLSDEILEAMFVDAPPAWVCYKDKITRHFQQARSHADTWAVNIQRSLLP